MMLMESTDILPVLQSTRRRSRGFTLVEILTSLFVLVIGITGTLAIIMRSAQMGTAAADRNNASVLIPEAIDDIKRMMALPNDRNSAFYNFYAIGLSAHAGELMDTVDLTGGTNPFANVAISYSIPARTSVQTWPLKNLTYPLVSKDQSTGRDLSLVYWPLNPGYARVMGQQQLTTAGFQTLGKNGVMYRALFKLEPHSDWVPNPYDRSATRENVGSEFVGVYVLTLTMYRFTDPEPAKPLSDTSNTQKRLQQIADPVVVYLHDTKVRQ